MVHHISSDVRCNRAADVFGGGAFMSDSKIIQEIVKATVTIVMFIIGASLLGWSHSMVSRLVGLVILVLACWRVK